MPVLRSTVDVTSEEYARNRTDQLTAVAALDEQLELVRAGGGSRYAERHHERGRLLVRERLELLLDRDSPFLELSSLAAWGTEFTVGASILTGVGVVSGVECVVIAHDPTVRGGSMNPMTLRKNLRALEIARTNRLPVINLVESGGADLPTQSELFVNAGKIFHDLTELSANGVPTVALVFGNSTAGGAYVPGMCDYAVLVDGHAKVFLGGPPLVKMATGEEADGEQLGGADMHSRVSGLSDHFAVDEVDCIRIGRQIMSELNWHKLGPGPTQPADPPSYDPDELLGITPSDFRVPVDPHEVLARVVDGSRFGEYKPLYGTSLVTGWASVHGFPVGVLANARGVLFGEEAKKATEFILLANQTSTPLVFLQNTTGYMVEGLDLVDDRLGVLLLVREQPLLRDRHPLVVPAPVLQRLGHREQRRSEPPVEVRAIEELDAALHAPDPQEQVTEWTEHEKGQSSLRIHGGLPPVLASEGSGLTRDSGAPGDRAGRSTRRLASARTAAVQRGVAAPATPARRRCWDRSDADRSAGPPRRRARRSSGR